MWKLFLLTGLLCGLSWADAQTGPCEDMDTQSCEGFHKVKPDLCSDPTFYQTMCKRFCAQCPVKCYSCPHPVRNPSDCNTTTTCGPNMLCMTKRFTAADGHLEYLMSCETKEVCDILTDGFGKRSDVRDRPDRAVTLECCNRDGCNAEFKTTTAATTTTTTATTTTTHRPPTTTLAPSCYRDIVFVIVTNGHTHPTNLLHFVEQVVSSIDVGPMHAQVALQINEQIQWPLDAYPYEQQLLSKLHHQVRDDDKRFIAPTHRPLHYYHTASPIRTPSLENTLSHTLHLFSGSHGGDRSHGDRPQAENAVVVITDTSAYHDGDYDDISSIVHHLHAIVPDVVTVSVGDAHLPRIIPTDGYHAFSMSHTYNLGDIVDDVAKIICA